MRCNYVQHLFFLSNLSHACVFQVKYILENNIDDSELAEATGLDDLTFSEEVYDQNGRLAKVNSREKNLLTMTFFHLLTRLSRTPRDHAHL